MNQINNPELELSVIRKIMEDSRQTVVDNGVHLIFWGVLVTLCLLANYYMIVTKTALDKAGMLWAIMMPLGAVVDMLIVRRMVRRVSVSTFGGKLLGLLWLASGLAMFMLGFLGPVTGAYNPVFICPIISVVLGVSYFVSGSIQQLPWLRNISYGWWAGSVVMFLYPGKHTLLIFAGMMLLFQVVPGLIMNRKAKGNQELQNA